MQDHPTTSVELATQLFRLSVKLPDTNDRATIRRAADCLATGHFPPPPSFAIECKAKFSDLESRPFTSRALNDWATTQLLPENMPPESQPPLAADCEAVAWYVFADTEHWVTMDRDEAERNRTDGLQVRPLVFNDTHQPAAATVDRDPDGYAYRYPWHSGGTVIRMETNGNEVNGSKPIETIPYYFGTPPATPTPPKIPPGFYRVKDAIRGSVIVNRLFPGDEILEIPPAVDEAAIDRVTDYLCEQEYDIGGRADLRKHVAAALAKVWQS